MKEDSEKIAKQIQALLKERGTKALEMARQEILKEKIECKEIKEALKYFMTKYWNDLARPTLLSLACESIGGDPYVTTPIAIPMSLISGATDIHDDIIDESKTKYGRPTVYGKYGRDVALLAGDALFFKGLIHLNQISENVISKEKMEKVVSIIKKTFFELGDAESLELGFRNRFNIKPKEYLHLVEMKSADVDAHTRIGAIIGGGMESEIDTLGIYGRFLGMTLTLRDDLQDVMDQREFSHRIRKEFPPLPIIYALCDSSLRTKIISILTRKKITNENLQMLLSREALNRTREKMLEYFDKASKAIQKVKYPQKLLLFAAASTIPYEKEEIFEGLGYR
jgi:geranylgeranyl pyrophosphate synthase